MEPAVSFALLACTEIKIPKRKNEIIRTVSRIQALGTAPYILTSHAFYQLVDHPWLVGLHASIVEKLFGRCTRCAQDSWPHSEDSKIHNSCHEQGADIPGLHDTSLRTPPLCCFIHHQQGGAWLCLCDQRVLLCKKGKTSVSNALQDAAGRSQRSASNYTTCGQTSQTACCICQPTFTIDFSSRSSRPAFARSSTACLLSEAGTRLFAFDAILPNQTPQHYGHNIISPRGWKFIWVMIAKQILVAKLSPIELIFVVSR